MRGQKKKQSGITLIALVISIIVMLILAGVSLNAMVGENGIISQAQNAKLETEDATWNEMAQGIIVEAYANRDYIEELTDAQTLEAGNDETKIERFRRENIKNYLISKFQENSDNNVVVSGYEDGFLIVDGERVFIVDRELKDAINSTATKMLVETNEEWTFTANGNGTCAIVGYNKSIGNNITIPAVLVDRSVENGNAYLVTEIGKSVFNYQPDLKHVDFSKVNNMLTKIGELAFANCENLEITIPQDLPSSITSIGDYAFQNCQKLNGNIDEIQNSGIILGNAVFMNCPNLTGAFQSVFNQYFYLKEGDIPSSTVITEGQFSGFSGLRGDLEIPIYITEIQKNAFSGCKSISKLTFAVDDTGKSSLTTIGDKAFEECTGIANVLVIPNSVTTIGANAFMDCSSITGLILPTDIATIGNQCFLNCTSLTGELKIPYSMTTIGKEVFRNIKITSLKFETKTVNGSLKGCTTIGEYSFYSEKSLVTITFPNTLTKIDNYGFAASSSIGSISFPNSLQYICDNTFYQCSNLTVSDWGNGIKSAGHYAFNATKVNTLPSTSTFTTIGPGTFAYLSFPSMNIIDWINSSSVTKIGQEAFAGCRNLYGNYNELKSGMSLGGSVFAYTQVTREMQVPKSGTSIAASAYAGTTAFKDGNTVVTELTIPSTVTSIGEYAFSGCSSLEKITIPSSVKSIGIYAFATCSSLQEINFEGFTSTSQLTSISTQTFRGCDSLKKINIPSSVTKIDKNAFQHAGNANFTLEIPGTCTTFYGATGSNYGTIKLNEGIKNLNLSGLTKCQNITVPNSVTSLSEECFKGCTVLSEITLGTGITSLPANFAKDVTTLTKVTFNSTITSIGSESFSGCTNLTALPGMTWTSLSSIGAKSFYNTKKLNVSVQIKNNCSIGQNAFLDTGLKWSRTN